MSPVFLSERTRHFVVLVPCNKTNAKLYFVSDDISAN